MKKPVIAVDIDDVLANEHLAIREFINEKYGVSHTPEDYLVDGTYWGYWERVWGRDKEEGHEWFRSFIQSGAKAHQQPIDGAIDTINHLKKRYQLVVVTSRESSLVDITQAWLEDHFPSTFKGVEFVHVWSGDKKTSKGIICKEIGANYLIDDSPEHCELAAEAGVTVLLFGEYGWTRSRDLPNSVVHVRDWRAVREYFDAR